MRAVLEPVVERLQVGHRARATCERQCDQAIGEEGGMLAAAPGDPVPASPALPADVPEAPAPDAPESAKQPATADAAPVKPASETA